MKRIFIITILFAVSAIAQNKVLTLDDCVRLGMENSNELKISKAKVESSDAKMTEANSYLLPQLKFQASYMRLSNIPPTEISLDFLPHPVQISPTILNNYNLKLSLQQPLFTGFKLWSVKSVAKNNYQASNYEYDKDLNEAAFKIQNVFWNYYKAEQIKKLINENLRLTQKHLEDTKNFMERNLATRNDLLKLQVQYSNTELQLIEAENNVDIARSNLNKQLNLPLEAGTEIESGKIDTSFNDLNLKDLINEAHANRNDLKSLEYRLEASDKGIIAANAGWYPSIYLVGDYYYSKPNQRIFPAQDKFKDTWDVGVSLQWDIWNWGFTSSQSTQAEQQKVQVEASLSQLKDAVELEVYQSFLTYKRAQDKIRVSRLTVDQANENYRITQQKYEQQLATSTDLIDAEVSLLQAKTSLTTSLVDYQIAKVKLNKSVGQKIY